MGKDPAEVVGAAPDLPREFLQARGLLQLAPQEDRATSGPDLDRVITSESSDQDALAPGVSLSCEVTPTMNLFGSYYRGISNPAPCEFLRGDAQMEH